MIAELQPVWKQFAETYAALEDSLAGVPDDRLHWEPAPGVSSAAKLVQHITGANLRYCLAIEKKEIVRVPPDPNADRQTLVEMVSKSSDRTHEVFSALREEDAHTVRADDWNPLGPPVDGPLDAVWFAHQIVRHSAYHLGQLNYLRQLGGFFDEG